MDRFNAVFIEDDEVLGNEIMKILANADFLVSWFKNRRELVDFLGDSGRRLVIDLIVLDRQLPLSDGEESRSEVGDQIFDTLLGALPDTPLIHLTGHSDSLHTRTAIQDRPRIKVGGKLGEVDSVYYFKKSDLIEFEKCVGQIAEALDELDNLEVVSNDETSAVERRVLRRVVSDCGALSVHASKLGGGLSDSTVWKCIIHYENQTATTVVVKISNKVFPVSRLQLATTGIAHVVGPVMRVSGLCCGNTAAVYQIAGSNCVDLFQYLVPVDNTSKVEYDMTETEFTVANGLIYAEKALSGISNTSTVVVTTLEDLIGPLISWSRLEVFALEAGIDLPPKKRKVTSNMSMQHGDLHPGNILVVDGSAIIIDLDREGYMPSIVDPLTLFMSVLFHMDTKFKSLDWPSGEELERMVAPHPSVALASWCSLEHELTPWFSGLWDAMGKRVASQNEFWGILMGYSARQLKYPDVLEDDIALARAKALFEIAAKSLRVS